MVARHTDAAHGPDPWAGSGATSAQAFGESGPRIMSAGSTGGWGKILLGSRHFLLLHHRVYPGGPWGRKVDCRHEAGNDGGEVSKDVGHSSGWIPARGPG